MRTLRNYISKELAQTMIMSLAMFTFVLVMGNFIKIADLVINKGVDIGQVAWIFVFLVPQTLTYTIPMSALTAILLTFGRLAQDNEIAAMRSGGINILQITLPVIIAGIILSLGCLLLNDRVLPHLSLASRKLIQEIGFKKPESFLEPQTFIKDFEGYILFIYDIDGGVLHKVRIYQPQENRPTRTIVAERGEFIASPLNNSIKLKLINGSSDEPSQMRPDTLYKLLFKTYYITLRLGDRPGSEKIQKKTKDMTLKELKMEMQKLKSQNIDALPALVAYHKRIAISFSTFAFISLALPLGILTKSKYRSVGFGISVFLIVIYYILMAGGNAIALNGALNAAFSMWSANIICVITGGILMRKTAKI